MVANSPYSAAMRDWCLACTHNRPDLAVEAAAKLDRICEQHRENSRRMTVAVGASLYYGAVIVAVIGLIYFSV